MTAFWLIAAYLAAGVAVAVWGHFRAQPIDRPQFYRTLLYCLAFWWFVVGIEIWSKVKAR